MINRFLEKHKKLHVVLLILSAVFFAATFLFHRISLNQGKWIESVYSRNLYQNNSDGMNRFSNFFPFALGELFVLMLLLLFLVILLRLFIYLVHKAYQRAFLLLSLLVFFVSILLFHYTIAWGLNNYRMPA
ncbi:MAG: DUF3810 family protein, partial [Vallitaleaceae bacterium]|nr:DUF3810 family protein [Vallitaleaceae bacterium]